MMQRWQPIRVLPGEKRRRQNRTIAQRSSARGERGAKAGRSRTRKALERLVKAALRLGDQAARDGSTVSITAPPWRRRRSPAARRGRAATSLESPEPAPTPGPGRRRRGYSKTRLQLLMYGPCLCTDPRSYRSACGLLAPASRAAGATRRPGRSGRRGAAGGPAARRRPA